MEQAPREGLWIRQNDAASAGQKSVKTCRLSAPWGSGTLPYNPCCFMSPRLRLPGAQLYSDGRDGDPTAEARGAGPAARPQHRKTP